MGGVLTQETGRQDVLICRGANTDWAVRWTNSTDGGLTYQPVDLTGDVGKLELRSPGGELWMTRAIVGTVDGLAGVELTPDEFTDPAWASRSGGSWLITMTHEGREERLGEGYFYLED